MAPRSIWNGTLAFGLVKVPVKLFSAIDPKGIAFREVHTKDDSPLQHRRVCKAEGTVVERSEVKKGFEVAPGEYVLLEPDEIKAASGEHPKTIEIQEFVDAGEIDPFFFNKSYYLGVREFAEPYALLASALGLPGLAESRGEQRIGLGQTGKAGIGRFTFHNKEYLVAVRARSDRLILHTLRFADEVVDPADLNVPEDGKAPTKKEVSMARKLVAGLTEDFDPGDFHDEYRGAVMDLIERKATGKKPRKRRRRKPRDTGDLASALEQSLAAQGAKS